jgi:hypothetical protein
MPGLMETPHHHFFDDRTDAAALDALIRGPIATLVNTKTTARHRARRQAAEVSQVPLVEARTIPS